MDPPGLSTAYIPTTSPPARHAPVAIITHVTRPNSRWLRSGAAGNQAAAARAASTRRASRGARKPPL